MAKAYLSQNLNTYLDELLANLMIFQAPSIDALKVAENLRQKVRLRKTIAKRNVETIPYEYAIKLVV